MFKIRLFIARKENEQELIVQLMSKGEKQNVCYTVPFVCGEFSLCECERIECEMFGLRFDRREMSVGMRRSARVLRTFFFFSLIGKMSESVERKSSGTNLQKHFKEELNFDRHDWPSKREFYTICGKLGEGATGNVSRVDKNVIRLSWIF